MAVCPEENSRIHCILIGLLGDRKEILVLGNVMLCIFPTTVSLTAPPPAPPLGYMHIDPTSQSSMSLWDTAGKWAVYNVCVLLSMDTSSLSAIPYFAISHPS